MAMLQKHCSSISVVIICAAAVNRTVAVLEQHLNSSGVILEQHWSKTPAKLEQCWSSTIGAPLQQHRLQQHHSTGASAGAVSE